MVSTSSSGSVVSRTMGTALRPAKRPNSWALPSMTGSAALGPMSPRPSTAVPSEMMATLLPVHVYVRVSFGSSWMASQTWATPGV